MQERSKPGKYLGMSMHIGKRKKEVFGFIGEEIRTNCKRGVIRICLGLGN